MLQISVKWTLCDFNIKDALSYLQHYLCLHIYTPTLQEGVTMQFPLMYLSREAITSLEGIPRGLEVLIDARRSLHSVI